MKPKKIEYSKAFIKNLKKLPKSQLRLLVKQEVIFRKNPFDPRLKTHKLSGKLLEFYAFSVSLHWRVVFHIRDDETIILDNIGSYEIYR